METDREAIVAIKCRDLVIENVRVLDNRSRAGTITVRESRDSRISHCLVRNYMRVTIDDRTQSEDWGYAFNCTDGTGISVSYSTGTLIEGNRIVEENLVPTPEIKAQHRLGDYVKKNPEKGRIISQQAWEADYTDNWQQGSGIIVTAPHVSDLTRIIGNHTENAAQGIDLHCEQHRLELLHGNEGDARFPKRVGNRQSILPQFFMRDRHDALRRRSEKRPTRSRC